MLIVRVHPEILRNQRLPEELLDEKNIWKERYRSIVDLERHLYRNGTRIVKIFLNLSYEEQRKRFLARIDEPDKNWKVSPSDNHERKYWKHYMEAYEDCLNATSTRHAPWYAVPADDKENARLIVSRIVLDALKDLKMAYPKTTEKRRLELQAIGKQLIQREVNVELWSPILRSATNQTQRPTLLVNSLATGVNNARFSVETVARGHQAGIALHPRRTWNRLRQDRSDAAQQQPVIERQSAPDFFDSSLEWRRVFAETWGTFLLVLVAAGGGVVAQ